MKKFFIAIVIIIILLLISGYIEDSYCHNWVTTPPLGRTIQEGEMIRKEYDMHRDETIFCRINAYPAVPGILLFGLITGKFGGMLR